MSFKCKRHDCGASRQNNPNDAVYCSGKCRKLDGGEPIAEPAGEAPVAREASLKDYKNHPKDYRRRLEPEKLNWGPGLLNPEALKQCGFRSNRKPLPGDWDYEDE